MPRKLFNTTQGAADGIMPFPLPMASPLGTTWPSIPSAQVRTPLPLLARTLSVMATALPVATGTVLWSRVAGQVSDAGNQLLARTSLTITVCGVRAINISTASSSDPEVQNEEKKKKKKEEGKKES